MANGDTVNGHVASAWFGRRDDLSKIGMFDTDNIVGQVTLTGICKDKLEASLILREAYDLTYKIYPQEQSNDPISIMKMHPTEDHITDGEVATLIDRIVRSKLPSLTNTSLLDLIEMPSSILEPLITIANEKVERESSAAEDLLSDMEG